MKEVTKRRWLGALTLFVFGTLFVTTVFTVVRVVLAPVSADPAESGGHIKSDYYIVLAQCVLGMAAMLVPGFLQKRFRITLPHFMHILFVLFLYAAIYLGEARNFYNIYPDWDSFLHVLSAAMLGALGFSLVSMLNGIKTVRLHMSPLFVAIFAFCFALTMGVIWEMYEFTMDGLLGLNMQKHMSDGVPMLGRAALADTMKDLIVDALGALVMSVVGFFSMRRSPEWIDKFDLQNRRSAPAEEAEREPVLSSGK